MIARLAGMVQSAAQGWVSQHTTKVLYEHGDNDYYDFYNSFTGEGFSLLLNMAQGGVMPGGPPVTSRMLDVKHRLHVCHQQSE